jgi:hypothetical protein
MLKFSKSEEQTRKTTKTLIECFLDEDRRCYDFELFCGFFEAKATLSHSISVGISFSAMTHHTVNDFKIFGPLILIVIEVCFI